MNTALDVLKKTEEDVAALLVAGLSTQRAGREQLAQRATEVGALKLDRLAALLRDLAQEDDPARLAGTALTAAAMARKLRERVLPWPTVAGGPRAPLAADPLVRVSLPEGIPEATDVSGLVRCLEAGDDLQRAQAAALLVERGQEAILELARLASKGTATVRREAIAAIGRIGSEAALCSLVDLLGDGDCWRALHDAILPYGKVAIPSLAAVLALEDGKKVPPERRRAAAGLLYRLGEDRTLQRLSGDEDPVVRGFAFAASGRATGRWPELPGPGDRHEGGLHERTAGIVAMARAELTGDPAPLIDRLEAIAMNEAGVLGRWLTGSPSAGSVAGHFLRRLAGGKAKDRQRAANLLGGLADPAVVPGLAALVETEQIEPALAAGILGEIGGSCAVGILADIARLGPRGHVDSDPHDFRRGEQEAFSALGRLGDPATATPLFALLAGLPRHDWAESALIAFGDSAVGFLAKEMSSGQATPRGATAQRLLLQMKSRRAKEALKGTGADSVDALLSRLGHPRLGADAVKALAAHGPTVLDRLEDKLADPDWGVRRNALKAIDDVGGDAAHEVLRRAVERTVASNSELLYGEDVHLLAARRDERDIPLLVKALGHQRHRVQDAALHTLVAWGAAVVPVVRPVLDEPNPAARAKAIEILGRLGVVDAETKVLGLMSDTSPIVRRAAAVMLGTVCATNGSQRIVEVLGETLRRERDWYVESGLIYGLEMSRQRSAIPCLRECADRHSGMERTIALRAIERIEARPAGPPARGVIGKLRNVFGGR